MRNGFSTASGAAPTPRQISSLTVTKLMFSPAPGGTIGHPWKVVMGAPAR